MLTRRRWLTSAVALATLPWAAQARRAGSGLPFPLFDAHVHLRSEDRVRYPRAPDSTPAGSSGEEPEVVRVLRWMDQNGVAGGAAVQHRGSYGFDNRYLLDSTDQYSRRLVPVAALDAEDSASPDRIRALVTQHGLAGVRLMGTRRGDGSLPWLDSPAAHRTWAAVNDAGLVMDLMLLPAGPAPAVLASYGSLAAQYPKVRVVIDHCGWPEASGAPDFGLSPALRALRAYRNVYFKFTTANLEALRLAKISTRDALRHFSSVLGAERLMWGSDIGGNSAESYGERVAQIVAASAALSKRDRLQFLRETGRSVMANDRF